MSDTTSGATIFYTLDGSQPGTTAGGSTKQYSGPLTVSSTETIKALATVRYDHQRNGQCHIHHRIAGGDADLLAGRWQLYLSANGKHLDHDIGTHDDLLHYEWIYAYNQFDSIQRTYHGERERDVKSLRYQERLL